MSASRRLLPIHGILLLCATQASAADYPCWRGNGNGVGVESGKPLIQDLAKKKLLWESEERGLVSSYDFFEGGVGGLVYADGRIYLTCAVPEGAADPAFREQFIAYVKQTSGKPAKVWPDLLNRYSPLTEAEVIDRYTAAMLADVVLCIDAVTGKTVWKQVFPDVARNPNGRGMGGAPILTFNKPKSGPHNLPAVAGGKVAVVGYGGDLYCLDAQTGTLAWKKKVQTRLSPTSSVLPAAGNFLCLQEASTDPKKSDLQFAAFKADDGTVAWSFKAPADLNAAIGKPGPVRHVTASGEYLLFGGQAVEAASGKTLWQVPGLCNGSAVIGDGFLVLPGDGGKQGPIAYRLSDPFTQAPTLAWKLEAENAATFHCTPAIYRGHLWYKGAAPGDGLSRMTAVELATGKVTATEPFRDDACGSCLAGDGMIFYEDHAWFATPVKPVQVPGSIGTPGDGAVDYADCHAPCYVDGRMYVRGRTSVRAYDLRAP